MKRLLLFACLAVLLVACKTLPEPEAPGNSLVIGSFVLDFPNGFFDLPPRTIGHGVTLTFRNVTKEKQFTLTTRQPGFFYFLASGSDEYLLESYDCHIEIHGSGTYNISSRPLKMQIRGVPDKVLYLGHITKVYAAPNVSREYGDRSSTWGFQESISVDWLKDAVSRFMAERSHDSRWLGYEIVEVGKK